MPCYRPLTAYRCRDGPNPSGKWSLTFDVSKGYAGTKMEVPCGQCIGCRLERSRQWAMRCMHEKSLYENNCFITLTYNDDNLPADGSLNKKHFQDFMKRLRKKYGEGIRFFHCGEYGEEFSRPHYHACLFNHDFFDKYLWSRKNGFNLYRSNSLEELWTFGNSLIGDVTFESAAYVARYITKKVTGDRSAAHYGTRNPEYITMSRRPGIGKGWYEKYHSDVYPGDCVVLRHNVLCRPAKYYDRLLDVSNPDLLNELKLKRLEKAKVSLDNSSERLAVREKVQELRAKKLKRSYEAPS